MTRKEGWETILNEHIEAHLKKPQKWGTSDCFLFACNWIHAVTGVDPAKEYRPQYKTKTGAYRLIKSFKGGLQKEAERLFAGLGMSEIIKTMARRGDVALVPGNNDRAFGIVDLSGLRVAVQGKNGLDFVPVNSIIKSWRVG